MKKRHATAHWEGSGKEGKGILSTKSSALKEVPYTYAMRFGDEPGTNPEELIGAAHAGCFSMKLSFVLGAAGYTPDSIDTKATVSLDNGTITESHLDVTAKVPGLESAEEFVRLAQEALMTCPVSKALACNLTMEAKLI